MPAKAKQPGGRRALLISLFALFAVALTGYTWWNNGLKPVSLQAEPVLVNIAPGSRAVDVAEELSQKGVIRNPLVFRLYLRWQGLDTKIKSGEYLVSGAWPVPEIAAELAVGHAVEYSVTIPEGLTVKQVAELLEAEGVANKAEFLAAAGDESLKESYTFLAGVPPGPDMLEGYLFPDTYRYTRDVTARQVVKMMLDRFNQVFTPEMRRRAEELGLTMHQAVTLASIIEKEAMLDEERPVISGVFHNRLQIGMPLQSCATVQFILGEPKPVLSIQDTRIPSPYNTYLHGGLPPGPIAAPGKASLQAALYPEDVPYLYFVARGDGGHAFAETLAEHNANSERYLP